jgi:hypothetical protein
MFDRTVIINQSDYLKVAPRRLHSAAYFYANYDDATFL